MAQPTALLAVVKEKQILTVRETCSAKKLNTHTHTEFLCRENTTLECSLLYYTQGGGTGSGRTAHVLTTNTHTHHSLHRLAAEKLWPGGGGGRSMG